MSLLGLTGCNSGSQSDEILIGHYASLTGSEATFGKSTDDGIKLAVEEFNAAGGLNGKKVALRTYDDKSSVQEAGTAVTRLVTYDKVVAVLGEVASGLSLAGAPICQKHSVPMITPSSTNPAVTAEGDMIFRVCFIDPFQGYVCAKFARSERLNAERAAVLYDQSAPYSTDLALAFEKAFTELGGKIVAKESFAKGDPDFSAQLTTIRSQDPQVIFIPAYYTDVGNIAVQARKLGITVPLMGGDGWDSEELPKLGGDAVNGCFYSNHYSQQEPNPRVQEFIKKYKAAYGKAPDGLAALGYDAARILFEAMGRAKSLEGPDLAAAIAATKDFNGVTGTITIN